MNYSNLMLIINNTGRVQVSDVHEVAAFLRLEAKNTEINDDDFDEPLENDDTAQLSESAQYYQKVYYLAKKFLEQNIFIGEVSDFHNLAVEYSRQNAEDFACDIIEKGLEIYKDSINLLADYLEYGSKCNRFDRCEQIYKQLDSIPKERWNWRAFQFSINYLQVKMEYNQSENQHEKLEQLVLLFRKHLPKEEQSYFAESEFYRLNGLDLDNEKSKKILKEAVESPTMLSPKCALRLADIYLEEGNLDEAAKLLNKSVNESIDIQSNTNRAYLFVRSALCKMTQFYKNRTTNDVEHGSSEEFLVLEAYEDFSKAKTHSPNDRIFNGVEKLMDELEITSGVKNYLK